MIFTCRRTSSPSSSAAAKTGGRRGEVGGGAGLGTEVALWAESHRAVAGGLTAVCDERRAAGCCRCLAGLEDVVRCEKQLVGLVLRYLQRRR